MGDSGNSILFQLILIALLTLINAFFAAAEIAFVSLNKKQVAHQADQGDRKAVLLEKLIGDPGNFLATIQVGITFANLFSSASAATGLASRFADVLPIPYAQELSIAVITILLSYVTLVFGELFPKRIALQNTDKIARFSVSPILFLSKIALPFVKLLSFSIHLLAKLARMDRNQTSEITSREEIQMLAQTGEDDGSINSDELGMIRGVFELDVKKAREIMTPRTETFVISVDTPPHELAQMILNENYSRIPVYQTDSDTIVGVLNMKDYFKAARDVGFDHVDLASLLREPLFVPETKYIDDLLHEMQKTHNHLSILIDEYGGFSGIVTMEDLIEEIVGEIDDEHDESERKITRIDDHNYLISGLLEIDEFNERFGTSIQGADIDTVAGFILSQIGSIPEENEQVIVSYENMVFKVVSVKDNRIGQIHITIQDRQANRDDTND
ncbi:hemolysin family protein [Sporolactobacillus shoreicorticis]|uniref:Hemolysin family protein n=1 Tax=Sporolactobacillus shoreicorticis TaxID=1923877 RepID=A0ABW5S7D5_9BACL